MYTAILHKHNSFWFSKSQDFARQILVAHTRKLEKINLQPLMFILCPTPISLCLRELINDVVKCTLAFVAHCATFYCHHAYTLFILINGIQFCKKVNYFVLDLIRLCIHCNMGANSSNTGGKMLNSVSGI